MTGGRGGCGRGCTADSARAGSDRFDDTEGGLRSGPAGGLRSGRGCGAASPTRTRAVCRPDYGVSPCQPVAPQMRPDTGWRPSSGGPQWGVAGPRRQSAPITRPYGAKIINGWCCPSPTETAPATSCSIHTIQIRLVAQMHGRQFGWDFGDRGTARQPDTETCATAGASTASGYRGDLPGVVEYGGRDPGDSTGGVRRAPSQLPPPRDHRPALATHSMGHGFGGHHMDITTSRVVAIWTAVHSRVRHRRLSYVRCSGHGDTQKHGREQ